MKKIKGKLVEIIEYFPDMALVEEVESGLVYSAYYWEFDSDIDVRYNNSYVESNVISLEGWVQAWQQVKHQKNRQLEAKRKKLPKSQNPKQQKNSQTVTLKLVQ